MNYDYYTCPMHPEIHEDKLGKCPKCGGQNGSGILDKYVIGGSKKCFHCAHKYKVKISNLEFIFDPCPLIEKLSN